MGFLTGLISGFNQQSAIGRAERRADEDKAAERESKMLGLLMSSDDPEIADAAVNAYAQVAAGAPRPRGGFFESIVGGKAKMHPAVQSVLQLMRTPVPSQGIPVFSGMPNEASPMTQSAPPPPPQPAPSGASAAMPATAATQPGGGPSPAQLQGPPATTPPATPTALPVTPQTGLPRPTVQNTTPPMSLPVTPKSGLPSTRSQYAGQMGAGIPQPRHVFLSSTERELQQIPIDEAKTLAVARAKAQGDVEGDVAGYMAAGFTEQEARDIVRSEHMKRAALSGASSMQSVGGEMPDGRQLYAIFRRDTGQYLDPTTMQPLAGFKPRTVTASTSMGQNREALARTFYGQPFVKLDQTQQADVLAREQDMLQNQAFGRATGTGQANAGIPLSTEQRYRAITGLQDDWRKANSSYREMQRQYQLMETGLKRFREGDAIGGSQAVLVTFQKILDPSSVVRESEYARTPQGLSMFDRLQGFVDRLITKGGAGVPDEELAAMVETGRQFLANLENWNAAEGSRIDATALQFGIDPALIRTGGGSAVTPTQGATPPPRSPQVPSPTTGGMTDTNPQLPLGTRVGGPAPAQAPAPTGVRPRLGDNYTGERRQSFDGTILGNVSGTIVELRSMDGGKSWHVSKVH